MASFPSRSNKDTGESSHPGTSTSDTSVPGPSSSIAASSGGIRQDGPRNPAPMRIRRLPSTGLLRTSGQQDQDQDLRPARSANFDRPISSDASASRRSPAQPDPVASDGEQNSRRRSFSDPQRPLQQPQLQAQFPRLQPEQTAESVLPTVVEERSTDASASNHLQPFTPAPEGATGMRGRVRAASNAAKQVIERGRRGSGSDRRPSDANEAEQGQRSEEYETEVTDFLDVIDPEVSTLTTLNNVQNSLFVPYLGRLYSRQPTYELTRTPTTTGALGPQLAKQKTKPGETAIREKQDERASSGSSEERAEGGLYRLHTIKSTLSGMSIGHNYAVLPHGVRLEGWSEEEKEQLNDHVRHLMHSRREGFKRSMRAFGKYVRKPMGFFVTLYAFIITFWGAAWVLFLIGWIHAGNRQKYFVEICDQILTAMLVVFGIGLFPWRVVDTYHMIYIAHYHYKIWGVRRRRGLPQLHDPNDLPDTDPRSSTMVDPEAAVAMRNELEKQETDENPVLSPEQQRKLKHHQDKMAKSHTFFKPHETPTHRAFSIKLLITIVVLLDFHSFFQIALGGTTWGIYYRRRPRALTAVILACSITCNITSGIIISIGDHRSRKKEVFEQMMRQKRTDEAMKRIEKNKGKTRLKISQSMEEIEHQSKEQEVEKTLESKEAVERVAGR